MKTRFLNILLLFLVSSGIKGQDYLSLQCSHADNLFSNKLYYEAVTEYKRVLFFDSTGSYKYKANYKIAESFKAGARFDDAIKYFSVAESGSRNNEELFRAKTQIIRSNILRRTTDRALLLCDELEKDEHFRQMKDSINYWRGWAYMFADDWKKAANSFELINPNHELKILAERTDRAKVSVTFAKVISYILPGSGAIYSGNFLSGLMSMGWNALAGYWTVSSFMAKRAFDGIVVGELVWLRFYRGAIQNAEDIAVEKNLEIANKSLRFLQNEYKGIKP